MLQLWIFYPKFLTRREALRMGQLVINSSTSYPWCRPSGPNVLQVEPSNDRILPRFLNLAIYNCAYSHP